jgi:predicted transglutaminase-like cysteine proteinase
MKKFFRAALGLALLAGLNQDAAASMLSMPKNLQVPKNLQLPREHIAFLTPTLAPLAFVKFCMRYPSECRKPRMVFRGGAVKLNAERYAALLEVNRKVNIAIRPEPNLRGLAGEEWIINPSAGDCNDYAVSKKHQLRAKGWPAHALFLSEVVTSWGEHHLVLVVRTDKGDLVLDNMTGAIRPVVLARYQWVRAQKPGSPMSWHDIAPQGVSV